MRIRYETGTATLIQFIVGAGLSFLNGVISVVSGCTGSGSADCVSNAFVSLVLIMMTIVAYVFLLALGYVAQERRSVRLAYLLIASELIAALVSIFDARQSASVVDKFTNFISFVAAVWVIYVAWRLARAKGGRIVRRNPKR